MRMYMINFLNEADVTVTEHWDRTHLFIQLTRFDDLGHAPDMNFFLY